MQNVLKHTQPYFEDDQRGVSIPLSDLVGRQRTLHLGRHIISRHLYVEKAPPVWAANIQVIQLLVVNKLKCTLSAHTSTTADKQIMGCEEELWPSLVGQCKKLSIGVSKINVAHLLYIYRAVCWCARARSNGCCRDRENARRSDKNTLFSLSRESAGGLCRPRGITARLACLSAQRTRLFSGLAIYRERSFSSCSYRLREFAPRGASLVESSISYKR